MAGAKNAMKIRKRIVLHLSPKYGRYYPPSRYLECLMIANTGSVQENLLAYCGRSGYVDGKDNLKSGNRLRLLHLFRRALMSRLLSWTAALLFHRLRGFLSADGARLTPATRSRFPEFCGRTARVQLQYTPP